MAEYACASPTGGGFLVVSVNRTTPAGVHASTTAARWRPGARTSR